MTMPITIESSIHFRRRGRGSQKEISRGELSKAVVPTLGRVPRISRFMALAIRFEQLIQAGEVADYAELVCLGHVTRARMTQIMNLRLLAPDLQEELLFLPHIQHGRAELYIRQLQPIAQVLDWNKQRRMYKELRSRKMS